MLLGLVCMCVLSSVLADKPVPSTGGVNKQYQYYRNQQEIKFHRPIHKFFHTAAERPQRQVAGQPRSYHARQFRLSPHHQLNPNARSLPSTAQRSPVPTKHRPTQKKSARNLHHPAAASRQHQRPNGKAYAQHRLRKAHAQRLYSGAPSQRVVNAPRPPRKIAQTPLKLNKNIVKTATKKLKNEFDNQAATKKDENDNKQVESSVVEVKVKPTTTPVPTKSTKKPVAVVKKKPTVTKTKKPSKVTNIKKKPVKPKADKRDYKVASKPKFIIKQAGE